MAFISVDLKRRLVEAYVGGRTKTYEETAEMFGVGRATVDRALRRKRETGDVLPLPVGGNNPRRVDLEWLRAHAQAHPDARLVDRVRAWVATGGQKVGVTAMWKALQAIGWTHKKSRWWPGRETGRRTRSAADSSSRTNQR